MRCTSCFIVTLRGIDAGCDRQPTQNLRKRQKALSAKRRQAQKNYIIYLHDSCVHTNARNTPMAGTSFF